MTCELSTPKGSPQHDIRRVLESLKADLERRGKSKATVEAYVRDIRQFIGYLESTGHSLDIGEVDAEIIETWDSTRVGDLSPASRNRKLAALSTLFDYARKRRLLSEDPMDLVERPREVDKESPCPTRSELERILQAEDRYDWRLTFRFLAETGLRRSELTELKVDDLDIEKAEITVRHGKGDKRRTVPIMDPELLTQLRAHVAGLDGSQPLFRASRGGKLTGPALWDRLRRAVKRAGLEDKGLTVHSLRHYFVTQKLGEGVEIHRVQKWAGHSDPSMILQTYAHVQDKAENAKVAARTVEQAPAAPVPAAELMPSEVAPSMPVQCQTPAAPAVYVNVNGSMVAVPVLGVFFVLAGGQIVAGQ